MSLYVFCISLCHFSFPTDTFLAYDPETSTMRYVGSIITVSSERPLDLVEKMNALANWPAKTPLRVHFIGFFGGVLWRVIWGHSMVTLWSYWIMKGLFLVTLWFLYGHIASLYGYFWSK